LILYGNVLSLTIEDISERNFENKKEGCQMEQKRVLFVNEGSWGSVKKEEYDILIGSLKRLLERATKKDYRSDEEKKRAKSVAVAASTEEAMEEVKKNHVDVLIFNSRSMIPEAREIKRQHRRLKVIVLTGLIPDDEVVLMDKGWISSLGGEVLEEIVFD